MSNAKQLVESWDKLYQGAFEAIKWVENTRSSSQRLDNEAESLNLDLYRLRNQAKRLGTVSDRPVTAGFFGLSQAGKSYLISALAAGENGKLETEFDGKQLDFISHVNPPGGGKEATGLVTRFSRTAKPGVAGFPIELRLFSELEIAKVLLNAYVNDFDKEKVEYSYEQTKLNEIIKRVQNKVKAQETKGVSAEDVVDLQDYAMENFRKSLAPLEVSYWSRAVALAPYLDIAERAVLFSPLWGEVPEMTETYVMFAQTLQKLGNSASVYAPLSVIVKDLPEGGFSQKDSIMNVDILERLNSSLDENVSVRPRLNAEDIAEPVTISLAQLAMLTAELVFPLINKTRVSAFETVDLLDFPGYRGRMQIKSIDEVKDGKIPQLLLRGKVAYLFERYTDSQEMSILIMCTPSNSQIEINEVGPVLERWIKKTQGEDAKARAARLPGLLWAITKFDIRVQTDLAKTEDNLKISWGSGGLLQQTLLERFSSYSWLENWSNNQPFNNIFLVRKPGFKVPFFEVDNEQELAINPKEEAQLALMRSTFAADPEIQKHVKDPEQAWDAMMMLNDGGMKRISDYLEQIAQPEVKQGRITEQLNQAIHHIMQRFDSWYQSGGEEEIIKKREFARKFLDEMKSKIILLGEFLRALQLSQESIRSLYLDNDDVLLDEEQEESSEVKSDESFGSTGFGDLGGFNLDGFDLFEENASGTATSVVEDKKQTKSTQEPRFAKNVFKAWINHLRNLSSDSHFLKFYGFNSQIVDEFVGEIITAASRLKLQQQIGTLVLENESTGFKRDQIVERQVVSVNLLISDFLAWLGILQEDETKRPQRANGSVVFSPVIQAPQNRELPVLNEQPSGYTQSYMQDWFRAFAKLCENNAGSSEGREIDVTQNANLGKILNQFKQAVL